ENFNFSERDVYGIAKSGEYGIEADFVDIETSEVIPHARKKEHSETYPFFFHFSLPTGLNSGILILQVFKVFGIKTLLEKTINEYLSELGLIIEFNRLISDTLLEQIEKSRLMELQLIRYDVPRDIADKIHNGRAHEISEIRTFHVKSKQEISLTDKLKSTLSNREKSYYEILGVQYDEIKAIIEQNGSKSVLTFGNQNIFREFMPLDGDIPISHGFPKYEYLLEKTGMYIEHLLDRLGD
ncbi:MAG: hypothetical protein KAT05_12570, partial [Spirochaetes bacterium]|nr:hypothetical protein [Spirochaetota bacterium]